jgi:hypothetical protein
MIPGTLHYGMTRTGTFRYVLHRKVEEYLKLGWMFVADLGPHHGAYSVLMWRCDEADCG